MNVAQQLDKATLVALERDAKKRMKAAERAFRKHDDADAMHDAEHWHKTVEWLRKMADTLEGA